MTVRVGVIAVAASLLVSACTSGPGDTEVSPSPSNRAGCPVTRPVPHGPVQLPHNPVVSNDGVPEDAVGNEALWVQVGESGYLEVMADEQGRLRTKQPWWRVKSGQLSIEADRLDGPGNFRYNAGTVNEYGPTGFVPSTMTFSAPGCWRITGHIGDSSLSFVAQVVVRSI